MFKKVFIIGCLAVLAALALVSCAQSSASPGTDSPQAEATVTALTQGKTGEEGYYIAMAQISPIYGKVTDATITPQSGAKIGVAYDVTINNPTQSRIKHVSHEILMAIFLEHNVSLVNINFHADGYTGMDDPIASIGGTSHQANWYALDDTSAWDAADGIFNADLSA